MAESASLLSVFVWLVWQQGHASVAEAMILNQSHYRHIRESPVPFYRVGGTQCDTKKGQ